MQSDQERDGSARTAFVLFDPVNAPARLYRDPLAQRIARTAPEVQALLEWAEGELAQAREVVLFLAFEAAQALAGLPVVHAPATPLAEGLSFARVECMEHGAVDAWLAGQSATLDARAGDAPTGLAAWRGGIDKAAYTQALHQIAQFLAAGDSYQIDYTFPLQGRAYGTPLALYRALRQRQPTAYRCLARLGHEDDAASQRWVLSLSPELFFTLEPGGRITARPMKGTAPRHADAVIDAEAASALAADPKNRAENLMILDLLRNDLGRIATAGSVRVPRRFSVEPYAQLWQMTSTVQAELAAGATWPAFWEALFPCGSVVGAPKRRSMAIIGELEPSARGLYTGAIGWIAPEKPDGGAAAGSPHAVQACFSVAIRTLEIDARIRRGTRAVRLGVGSGVVADSKASAEWDECLLKARFATALDPGFGLIETFASRWPQDATSIAAHLRRLVRSASYFGFRCDRSALLDAICRAHAALPEGRQRTRVVLRHDGVFDLTMAPMTPLATSDDGRVDVLLAEALIDDAALDPDDIFLRHKTTHRARYDATWRAAEGCGAFDALFFNTRGHLCEGGRSSVFVKFAGCWFTPPLRCGLLPGVARAAVLADRGLAVRERALSRADLLGAEDLLVTNALHGALRARLVHPGMVAGAR
ncbi:MAG: bifunctional aminodeoxychorismate synthase component I/aminotransferase [Proteobacteria bacterium]|nr:bifunctional aminodeoxychorismate synthase component I/aminotransferase [Pseudomonadota bacterium]